MLDPVYSKALPQFIQNAEREGAVAFDLGCTDCDYPGLIAFKEHWAAERHP